ncbi:MAG TPA: cyclic nucleotide-binding protein [Micromonosporaceae bacterium]
MAVVDAHVSVWEALAGRAPGQPLGPADPGLWAAVAERINPAKARPVLREGIETAELVSVRGVAYTMLRSPDAADPCYLRLTPEEAQLTTLMDGSRTLARLVADFARLSGRLAPDQVRRVVADLAGNRMLEELPVDAFAPLRRVRRTPWPLRLGRGLLAVVRGRRVAVANIDPLVTVLYRAGGRLLFTRPVAALLATVAGLGLIAFCFQWWAGEQSVFLTANSYALGAAVLLGLNVLALASHELGHALATKHAGRRVPRAGFLIYFGIPSVFVDTTDVWMAGRRARLRTTAAGPATGLVLAGVSALVGFSVPELAPVCFKLSFAWYLNALFNLNPFLALDGYYLVMDWLEIPNLRARGLAWVVARVRRRPPSWSGLDREGRLVALYGLLAVGWLVIALNLAYRLYVDRVDGLVIGLWRSGPVAQVLLAAVVLALASPVVYVSFGWAGRRLRRMRRRLTESRASRDEPRRLAALRRSTLRDLPEEALRTLAGSARWRHPRTGEQLVLAGTAQPYVFAVVDGALEARLPGDPSGTVRERVGAGGVVGLAPALTGAPSALAWHTAGTTLLAIPSTTVAATVGPVAQSAGLGFGTAGEAEQLFAEAPGLAWLSTEDRLGLATVAVPVSLAPGAPVTLASGDSAVVVAAGIVDTPDGQQLGRGTLIGPVGEEYTDPAATARTPVRMFSIPAVSGLALLVGTSAAALASDLAGTAPGRAPVSGLHPPASYPPLAAPPSPPPTTVDASKDRWFERRLWWFLLLVLLLALLFTGGNVVLAARAWAEMPTDRALLHVESGTATVGVGDHAVNLGTGDDLYVGEGDSVSVDPRSRARLTFRGGASSMLCAGTLLRVGALASGGEPVQPVGAFDLSRGRAVVDTATATPAFLDLSLDVGVGGATVSNVGRAYFAVEPSGTVVSTGEVFVGAVRQPETGATLGCGDGGTALPPPTTTPSAIPTLTPTPTPTLTPSATSTATPTTTPTTPRTTTPTTTHSTPPTPPKIGWTPDGGDPTGQVIAQAIDSRPCDGQSPLQFRASISDNGFGTADQVTKVVWSWSGFVDGTQTQTQTQPAQDWQIIGPDVPYNGKANDGGSIIVKAAAYDAQGDSASLTSGKVIVTPCRPLIAWSAGGNPPGNMSQQLATGAPCTPNEPTAFRASGTATGGVVRVVFSWSGFGAKHSDPLDATTFWADTVGPFPYPGPNNGDAVTVTVTVIGYDAQGEKSNELSATVDVAACKPG